MPKPLIFVDADACPVKQEIASAAAAFGVSVRMVASYAHAIEGGPGIEVVQVDRSDQAADLYIVNHLSAGDVLITQDFGLAALALAKRAVVLSNRGQVYTERTIGFLLENRNDSARMRRAGKHSKGPRPFTNEDRERFLQTLTKVLRQMQENFPT